MAEEEFVLDTPIVRGFVADVRAAIDAAGDPGTAIEAIRPRFAELLADPAWLPGDYAAPVPESGMGGGIGQWLLYRAGDGSLSLFALVVPSGSETPVHDHLAWGLVGLYRGTQDEDIHRVRTTSAETSVSIHLLANDTGCVWRHAYDPDSGEARPFRSGYANVPCEEED